MTINTHNSADTYELYPVAGDHKRFRGMSLNLYPQRDFIHSRPTSELDMDGTVSHVEKIPIATPAKLFCN
jgi:hypothetical protein